jgi:hypothetical protein
VLTAAQLDTGALRSSQASGRMWRRAAALVPSSRLRGLSSNGAVMQSFALPFLCYSHPYVRMRRMTLTELLIDGLRLRLETPADPRELVLSDDSNTVLQHVQELVNAAVQVALATEYGPPTPPPARAVAAPPT